MKLFQKEVGYRYNSDTLLLYDFICSFAPKGTLLDVGCGCGILGLLLKRDFSSLHVSLLDIQVQNCEIAKANALENQIALEEITCNDFLKSMFDKKFDFIVSNPPFYHSGVVQGEDEHLNVSRHSSHLPFDAFAKKVTKSLSNKGYFIFCYDAKQIDTLMVCLHHEGLKVEDIRFVHTKEGNEASLVMIRARKNSKTLTKVHPPLFVIEGQSFTPYVQAIFENSKTQSYPWQR